MCMNCGCGQPHDDHGKPENVTLADLLRAADANEQTLRESAQHIVETVALVAADQPSDRGLAQPAGPGGAAAARAPGSRGTPSSES